jgi:hypothetical protein
MAVKMATKQLLDCRFLGAITIYTEAAHFGQPVLATVATVHYLHTVNLLHMQHPHQCLLPIIVIACVPTSRYEYYSVGL